MPVPDWAALRFAMPDVVIDAAGTRRRMGAMALRRIDAATVKAGCSYRLPLAWDQLLAADTVSGQAAADIRDFYTAHRHTVGGAGDDVPDRAARAGALPDHAWPDDTIDDPRARPDLIRPDSWRMVRRLRALVRDGHPIPVLAEQLREWPPVVERWLLTGKVPRYAGPGVLDLYTRLEGHLGGDPGAAAFARERQWRGTMAWEGIDIDNRDARPSVGPVRRAKDQVDEGMVANALLGCAFRADLTSAELEIVVRELGKTLGGRQIAVRLRWSAISERRKATMRDDQAGVAVTRWAYERNIPLRPDTVVGWAEWLTRPRRASAPESESAAA